MEWHLVMHWGIQLVQSWDSCWDSCWEQSLGLLLVPGWDWSLEQSLEQSWDFQWDLKKEPHWESLMAQS